MLLKDGDKRSDVYSLGRIINFIMTAQPMNSHHIFRNVSEKATNSDAAYRYADAGQLSVNFEKCIKFHENAQNEEAILKKMASKVFDSDVEAYDPFAIFAYRVIKENFTFVVKEIAATILRYVATDVNRFSAQNLVERLKKPYHIMLCAH